MTTPRPRSLEQPKQLGAGTLQAEISSFALRLAAEGKAAKTIRTYTEAVQWFAAARLPGRASWEQADRQDIQQWMTWLLSRYSNAYASNQYRALQQFFKWLAAEDELPDPMAGAAAAAGHRQAGPGLHRRGADPAGTGLCGPQLRAAP
jgi:site-specific recombinase XerD